MPGLAHPRRWLKAQARCRDGYGAERYENEQLQRRVATEFERFQGDSRFHCIEAGRSSDAVHADVREQAMRVLHARDAGALPLQELWGDENAQVLTNQ